MSSDPDGRTLERRLAAVERAVDGVENDAPRAASPPPDRESLEERLTTLEARVDELDAAVQSVRGFLGGVDAVNEEVESRADAAIAAVERLERRLDEEGVGTVQSGSSVGSTPEPGADEPLEGADETSLRDAAGDEPEDRTLRDRLRGRW